MDRRSFLSGTTATLGLGIPVAASAGKFAEEALEQKPQIVTASKQILGAQAAIPGEGQEALRRFAEESHGEFPKWMDWWKDNYLRVDFDMLMTDASPEALSMIDPEDIVRTIADAGLQGMWGYVQDPSGWVYYPSKVARQFPQLKGRDLVGELIAACHKRGLKYVGYYDPMEMGVEVTRHPEWRTEYPGDTVPSSPRLWGRLCFNRPGALDFMLKVVRESVSNYEMDGVLFDEYWVEGCACSDCQRRFREETGREMPFYYNWPRMTLPDYLDRPEYGHYLYQVQKWIEGWAVDFRRTTKEARPNCIVLFQSFGYRGMRGGRYGYTIDLADTGDIVSRDAWGVGYQFQHSLEMKYVRGYSRHLPFEAELPIAEHHADETSARSEGLLKQQYGYVLSHGGSISYIDDMDWAGRISKVKYVRMKRVNEWARERFPYLGGVLVADAGLYLSQESHMYHPKSHHFRWSSPRGDAERGLEFSFHNSGNVAFAQAMIQQNIPFDILHRNKLKDLGRHKVIYLNNVEVMREAEAVALREFVQGGGGLVVTYRTGMRDEHFQERPNFLLSDLMGADFLETPDLATSFIMTGDADRTEGFFPRVGPDMPYFEVQGTQCYVKPREGAQVVAKVARPKRPYLEDGFPAPNKPPVMQLIDSREIRQANAGYRYEAEITTEHPAIVLNHFGKGRVAYCAAVPAYNYIDDIHDLIMGLVNWAAGGKIDTTFTTNAPGPVEIVVMEQLAKNRTVVHALNWQQNWPGVKASHVEVAVKTFGRRAKRAHAVEAKTELPVRVEGNRVAITFPPVEAWETVIIEWA